MRKFKIIRTDDELAQALEMISHLMETAKPETTDGDDLELLTLLVEKYEEEHYPIPPPDPIEAIKFRMEQMDVDKKTLYELLGGRGRASEVLNRKRGLSMAMVRRLHDRLRIPLTALIADYALRRDSKNGADGTAK